MQEYMLPTLIKTVYFECFNLSLYFFFLIFFIHFLLEHRKLYKKNTLDLLLASKTYEQLTSSTRTSYRVIQPKQFMHMLKNNLRLLFIFMKKP